MFGLSSGYSSLAEACGEREPQPLTFAPGVDYDPSDPDEREVIGLAMANDSHDRMRALERENERLRRMLDGDVVGAGCFHVGTCDCPDGVREATRREVTRRAIPDGCRCGAWDPDTDGPCVCEPFDDEDAHDHGECPSCLSYSCDGWCDLDG